MTIKVDFVCSTEEIFRTWHVHLLRKLIFLKHPLEKRIHRMQLSKIKTKQMRRQIKNAGGDHQLSPFSLDGLTKRFRKLGHESWLWPYQNKTNMEVPLTSVQASAFRSFFYTQNMYRPCRELGLVGKHGTNHDGCYIKTFCSTDFPCNLVEIALVIKHTK